MPEGKAEAKLKLFVAHYLADPERNGTKAAIAAGYSAKTAYSAANRLLKNVEVQALIESKTEKRINKLEIDADYVLGTIRDTVERCRSLEPVVDKKGNRILLQGENGEVMALCRFDPLAVLKGCELLGKNLKLFTDKHELSGKDGGPIKYSSLEELDAAITRAYERAGIITPTVQ